MVSSLAVKHHPDIGTEEKPGPLTYEVEVYQGCVRYKRGCKFCIEPKKGVPLWRTPDDVIEEIRSFLRINMYNNTNVLKKNENGKKIIKKLFNKIAKNPRKFLNKEQLKFDKHRAIADFISGMTDRYAINLYKKI